MKQYKLLYSSSIRRTLLNVDYILDLNHIYHWINESNDCWEYYIYCTKSQIKILEDDLDEYGYYNYCIIDMARQYDYKELKAKNAETEL